MMGADHASFIGNPLEKIRIKCQNVWLPPTLSIKTHEFATSIVSRWREIQKLAHLSPPTSHGLSAGSRNEVSIGFSWIPRTSRGTSGFCNFAPATSYFIAWLLDAVIQIIHDINAIDIILGFSWIEQEPCIGWRL